MLCWPLEMKLAEVVEEELAPFEAAQNLTKLMVVAPAGKLLPSGAALKLVTLAMAVAAALASFEAVQTYVAEGAVDLALQESILVAEQSFEVALFALGCCPGSTRLEVVRWAA